MDCATRRADGTSETGQESPDGSAVATPPHRLAAVVFFEDLLAPVTRKLQPRARLRRRRESFHFPERGTAYRVCHTSPDANRDAPSPVDRMVYKQRLPAGERFR